nr:hypothetical protein CFP56_36426 [Quercus suber]
MDLGAELYVMPPSGSSVVRSSAGYVVWDPSFLTNQNVVLVTLNCLMDVEDYLDSGSSCGIEEVEWTVERMHGIFQSLPERIKLTEEMTDMNQRLGLKTPTTGRLAPYARLSV